MPDGAYSINRPSGPISAVVCASPHSGRDYPEWFLSASVLNSKSIRSSEDAWVDKLFQGVTDNGVPLLAAKSPRALIDFNRSPDEMDPALVQNARSFGHNPRISSGLGVIPRVVAGGRSIYRGKISQQEADQRIAQLWRPYHAALQDLLEQARLRHGHVILLDCHSMPRDALVASFRKTADRPEIVLGDRFGASASRDVVDHVEAAFAEQGFRVGRNQPFAGAFVTQAYGRPTRGQHVVQVEIDRSIYMDEATLKPRLDFDKTAARLQRAVARITRFGCGVTTLAAE